MFYAHFVPYVVCTSSHQLPQAASNSWWYFERWSLVRCAIGV